MALGPGKYDDVATVAREAAYADAVLLIVIDGKHGSGFSMQTKHGLTLPISELLRRVADDIDQAGHGYQRPAAEQAAYDGGRTEP